MDESPSPQPKESQWSAVIGIAIIVLLIIAGGIYFYFKSEPSAAEVPAVGAAQT